MCSEAISLHLHLYGVALEQQVNRARYDVKTGDITSYHIDYTIF
jgi:hypothetical protein